MEELKTKIDALFVEFEKQASLRVKGNQAAGVRSRKTSLEIEKLFKIWRKESVKVDA